ncbi:MAG: transposase [Deltaproteobacteria bacterium]|jgi:transposase|nr:transposase [Deltaproteobacteria bacterium]
MAYLNFNFIRGTQYLYGAVSHRPPGGVPVRNAICLGRVDPKTSNLIVNNNYHKWMDEYGPSLKTSLEECARKKKIVVRLDNITENNAIMLSNAAMISPPGATGAAPPPGAVGSASPPTAAGTAPPPGAAGTAPPPGAAGTAPPPGAAGNLSLTFLPNLHFPEVGMPLSEQLSHSGTGRTVHQNIHTETSPHSFRWEVLPSSGIWVPVQQLSADTIFSTPEIKSTPSPFTPMINNIQVEKEYISQNNVLLYGPTYLLTYIIKEIGLLDILTSLFPIEYPELITLIHFLIIENRSLMYCPFFSQLYDTYSDPLLVSSQRTSEMLAKISIDKINCFFKHWSTHVEENDYLDIDTSQISTYSRKIEYADYGRPKNSHTKKRLKQICLCLLYGQQSGLPVNSSIYNGSLNDVSLLINAVHNLDFLHTKKYRLVLDRGFLSKKNINFMQNHDPQIPFIIELPATTSLKRFLIENNKHIFMNPVYGVKTPSGHIYGTTQKVQFDQGIKLTAHVFIDQHKLSECHDEILDEFSTIYKDAQNNPHDYIEDEEFTKFLKFKKSKYSKTGYNIDTNLESFNHEVYKNCWFVFLSNEIQDPEVAITTYRMRDVVEKAYFNIKHRLGQNRPRTRQSTVYQSKNFVGFLALIVLSRIYKVMSEKQLFKKYTLDELILTLNTIKITKYSDKQIITPLTAEQKKIFDHFKCPVPLSNLP